nr:YdcF family protein [Desulfobulbaceae bacterium]
MVTLSLSREDSEEFGDGVDRILKGMDMVRQKQADYLVISGGSGELIGPVISESTLLRAFAVRFGIPQEKILIDANSRNTRENALMTKVLLESNNLKKTALITSAFHMPRAMGCFKAVGLSPDPIPVDYQVSRPVKKDFRNYFPKAATLSRFSSLVHELVGIIVYGLRGYAVY